MNQWGRGVKSIGLDDFVSEIDALEQVLESSPVVVRGEDKHLFAVISIEDLDLLERLSTSDIESFRRSGTQGASAKSKLSTDFYASQR